MNLKEMDPLKLLELEKYFSMEIMLPLYYYYH